MNTRFLFDDYSCVSRLQVCSFLLCRSVVRDILDLYALPNSGDIILLKGSLRNLDIPDEAIVYLRKLDASVTTPGTIASLAAGIIGALILGIGMCCCMVWGGGWFIPGIIIGLIGIATLVLAYPLYVKLTEKQRKKLAPEILRLTEELMK